MLENHAYVTGLKLDLENRGCLQLMIHAYCVYLGDAIHNMA